MGPEAESGVIFCDEAEPDEVVELEPLSPEEALELWRELERFRDEARYFDAHRQELLGTYPDQWVAVYGKRVVAAAAEHRVLLDQLEVQGIPAGRAYREYLSDDDIDLFL